MKNVRKMLKIDEIHRKGILGEDIGIAILDTGIYMHDDFIKPNSRVVAFKDFVNKKLKPYDDNGHGTHVAGICASSGYASKGAYKGIAPRCNIIIEKVLDGYGIGCVEYVEEAINWTIKNKDKYGIEIVNLSIGSYGSNKIDTKRLLNVVEYAWDEGLVVLTAAGNKGPKPYSITEPGTCKKIITVGAVEEIMSYSNSGRKIKNFSGCGPTRECIVKPEVVAPGANIISCNNSSGYINKSGTSMSTPIVSGIIALGLGELYKKSVNGLSRGNKKINRDIVINKLVKKILFETSYDLNKEKNKQGWGLINANGMVEELMKY